MEASIRRLRTSGLSAAQPGATATANDTQRVTKAKTTGDSQGRNARPADRRARPRCGGWVYYVLPDSRPWRRLWVKPRDPRTPKQRSCRARLGAASSYYSASLTDRQQDACIAAGAKVRSRPRLGQWGWLTGQQAI